MSGCKKNRLSNKSSVFAFIFSWCSFSIAFATEENKKWDPYIDTNLKYGNHRDLGRVDVFIPAIQNEDSMIFLDLRTMLDTDGNKEGNFGLGFRKMYDDYIFGVYGFYDRRKSEYDNMYNQGTFGVEFLTEKWDARANYYLADGQENLLSGNADGSITIINNGGNFDFVTGNSIEKSLDGFDIEVGRVVPKFEDLSLFAGYYYFYDNDDDVDDVTGIRTRAEYKINDFIGLEYEYSNDDLRDNTHFAGIRFRYAFNKNKDSKSSLSKLASRMTNKIVRDIDIVTPVKNTVTKYVDENGTALGLLAVNSSTFGSNSITAEQLAAKSRAGDIIYLDDEMTVTGNFTLKDGQKLLGERHGLTVAGKEFIVADPFSTGAVINGVTSDGISNVITAGKNNTISGLQINGDGGVSPTVEDEESSIIYAYNPETLVITDNILNNATEFVIGIESSENIDMLNIANNSMNQVGQRGINFLMTDNGIADNITIDNNYISTLGLGSVHGIALAAEHDSQMNISSISNNEIENFSNIGIHIRSSDNAIFNIDKINNNNLTNINGNFLNFVQFRNEYIDSRATINVNEIAYNNMTANDAGMYTTTGVTGINLGDFADSGYRLDINVNSIHHNVIDFDVNSKSSTAIYLHNTNSNETNITANISNNTINLNHVTASDNGIRIEGINANSKINLSVTDNNISNTVNAIAIKSSVNDVYGPMDFGFSPTTLNTDIKAIVDTNDMGSNTGSGNIINIKNY